MEAASTIEGGGPDARRVAKRVLLVQRIAIGVILVLGGIVGLIGVLWSPGAQSNVQGHFESVVGRLGLLAYPLLKGSEVLTRVYLGAKDA